MPTPISNSTKTAILRQYFRAESRDETARSLHIGGCTVSGVVREFESKSERIGILQTARMYGVSEEVGRFRNLSIDLKKNNIGFEQAHECSCIAGNLQLLKVDTSALKFLFTTYDVCTTKGYSPENLV